MNTDPTKRFGNRVDDYVRFRPHYPSAVIDLMRSEMNLSPGQVIVDVGSGTGFLSELFLSRGHQVYGVEPNLEMRVAGEALLAAWPSFTSVPGSAEATALPSQIADFVVAGQAFHWFQPVAARQEFHRVLRPAGWVVLVWNDRLPDATGVYSAYEQLIKDFRTDAAADKRTLFSNDSAELAAFFSPSPCIAAKFPVCPRIFDFPGLLGRLLSSSYAPKPGHPRYEAMVVALQRLFDAHHLHGKVRFDHKTEIFFGHLGK